MWRMRLLRMVGPEGLDQQLVPTLRRRASGAAVQRPSRAACLALVSLVTGGAFIGNAAGAVVGGGSPADHKISPALQALAASSRAGDVLKVIVQGSNARAAAATAGRVTKDLGFVDGVAAEVRAGALQRLAHDPNVSFVSPNAPIAFAGDISASGLMTHYPGRASVGNPWSAGAYGAGVGIAIIDSGVAPSPDFGSRLVQVRLDGQNDSLDDTVGHGTMVAGVAAGHSPDGKFIGIAPRANIFALNINRPSGVYTSDVIIALKWVFDNAHAHNIRVVNLSLTETVKSSYRESALDLAVERVWASGVFVVVSAGNLGAGQVDYAPANDPLVMTIGAFDTMGTAGPGDDTMLSWSSSGKTIDSLYKPELVAPGRRIASPLPAGSALDARAPAANRVAAGYAAISGTSFAAPQVAGAAAIIFEWHPTWSPDNVKWVLIAKQGAKPRDGKVGALSLSSSYNYSGTPGRANQGVEALVCAPGTTCTTTGTVASKWDSSSWNSSSWNSSSWNSSSWNSSSWNGTANWDSSSWNSSSWNSSSWNSTSWNYGGIIFDPWA
jgi:serine protease AprX